MTDHDGDHTAADDDDHDVEPLLHVVLDRPAIAGNVGAAVRLCAATGAALHVCGSSLDPQDREMWRSGLDYWPRARVHFHDDVHRCLARCSGAIRGLSRSAARAPRGTQRCAVGTSSSSAQRRAPSMTSSWTGTATACSPCRSGGGSGR